MCHFQTCRLEATLDIESLILLTAIQNTLVAADLLCHEVERLNNLDAEFLALLVFRNRDVFDVTDQAEIVDAACYQRRPSNPAKPTKSQLASLVTSLKRRDKNTGHMWMDLQFPLHDQRTRPNDSLAVIDDENIVSTLALCLHPFIPLVPCLLCYIADSSEHA